MYGDKVPEITGNWGLIDKDTPKSAYTKPSYSDPKVELQLVFSDEFNTDGRTFYPGEDPYWEAVDLHYWAVRQCLSIFSTYRLIMHYCRPTTSNGTTPKQLLQEMAQSRLR